MNKHRNREDIIAAMLKTAMVHPKKTNIMYGANISYTLLVKYIDTLLKCGMLDHDKFDGNYLVTKKGKEFLERYKKVEEYERNVLEHNSNLLREREVLLKMIKFK